MSNHLTLDRQRCCKVVTFRSILPALVFIVALNLSYLVLKGPTPNAILAYGYLWNALFLAFPLAPLFEDTFFRTYLQVGLEERLRAAGASWCRLFFLLPTPATLRKAGDISRLYFSSASSPG